jgi:hypothetical protein
VPVSGHRILQIRLEFIAPGVTRHDFALHEPAKSGRVADLAKHLDARDGRLEIVGV